MLQKPTAILITAALLINLIGPVSAYAQDDRLTEMFQEYGFYVNNSQPGAYNAQTQGFITGGSLNVRSQYKTLRIGSLTAPNLRAGCGGMDIFFGGANFLNLQQYVDMLKALGQNALGYAFELGLETVCPTCNAVLKHLAAKANEYLGKQIDSCQAAKSLVNNILPVGDMAESSIDRCARDLERLGMATDASTARNTCLTDNQELGRIYSEAKENAQNNRKSLEGEPGIATPKVFKSLSAAEKALALNLLGTYVYKGPKDTGENPELEYVGPTIGFKDIMFGKPDASVYYPKALDDPDYAGLANGDIDDLGQLLPYNSISNPEAVTLFTRYLQDGGFVKEIRTKMEGVLTKLNNGSALTDDEKQFVNATIVPVQTMLDATRKIPGASPTVIDVFSGIVASYMVEELINGYVKEAMANANLQSQVRDDKFIERIEAVRTDTREELTKMVQNYETMFRSYELTDFFYKQLSERVGSVLSKAVTSAGGEK
jgi:hypothetical protein